MPREYVRVIWSNGQGDSLDCVVHEGDASKTAMRYRIITPHGTAEIPRQFALDVAGEILLDNLRGLVRAHEDLRNGELPR